MSDVTIPEDVIARVDAAVLKYGNLPILDGIKKAMAEVVADLVAAERERCAKIADGWNYPPGNTAHGIAQAIRSFHE